MHLVLRMTITHGLGTALRRNRNRNRHRHNYARVSRVRMYCSCVVCVIHPNSISNLGFYYMCSWSLDNIWKGAFVQLEFDLFNYAAYNTYFDASSTMTLAQTGVYTGPDAIQEYVYFADENSSYIQAKQTYVQETVPSGFDPITNICKFTTYVINGFDFEPGLTSGNTLNYGAIVHTYYSAVTNKIPVVQVFYTVPMLMSFFKQLQTRQVDNFVCDVLLGPGCTAELGDQAEPGLTKRKCLNRLSHLPLLEGEENWIDGNSQGCRYLHAVFALTNPFHCAHVLLIPAKDPKGNYICHWSADLSPDELFTQTKIDGLYDLCGTQMSLGLD